MKKDIAFTAKQKETVAEYLAAIAKFQGDLNVYLRGVLEGHDDRDATANYTLKPDGSGLVAVEAPQA